MEVNVRIAYRNDKLKELREKRGISQAQLSEIAGINKRMLQYYEQGAKDLNFAKLSTILKICIALRCDVADILTDTETLEILKKYKANH